jgi:hypothetical protein
MDLQDFLKNVNDEPSYIVERKLNELVRKNYNFQHLSESNRELVLSLVKKYKEKIRRGIGVSQYTINREMYNLFEKRFDLKLTEVDRDHIREILESFKQ